MSWLTDMLAAGNRLLTYYNGDEKTALNPGGMTGPDGMAQNWDPCIRDLGTGFKGVGEALTSIAASEASVAASVATAAGSATNAAANAQAAHTDRLATDAAAAATAADRQAVATDKATVHTDRMAADADAAATAADRLAVAADKAAAHTDRLAADADALATAADRQAVAQDRAASQSAAAVATATASTALWCGTAGGTAAALTLAPAASIPTLYDGLTIRFLAATANPAGGTTVKASPAVPAVPLLDPKGAALAANALSVGMLVTAVCSGGVFLQAGGGGALPVATASVLGGVKIGSGLSVAGDGTLSTAAGPTLPITDVTGTSVTMVAGNGYVANNASRVTLGLPTPFVRGQTFEVYSLGAGGWKVPLNAGQSIIFGAVVATGAADGLQSSGSGAYVRLVAISTTQLEVVAYTGPVVQIAATTQAWNAATALNVTLSGANLTASTGGNAHVRGYAIPDTGQWYFELLFSVVPSTFNTFSGGGVCTAAAAAVDNLGGGGSWCVAGNSGNAGQTYIGANASQSLTGTAFPAGSVGMLAVNRDMGKVFFGLAGVWLLGGNPLTGANPSGTLPSAPTALYPFVCTREVGGTTTFRPSPTSWTYPAPSGYNRLP